ncbi:hypothetical protein D3C81_1967690 [compost metagenome]
MMSEQSKVGSGTTRTVAVAVFETCDLTMLLMAETRLTNSPSATPVPTTSIMRSVLRSPAVKVWFGQVNARPFTKGSVGTPFSDAVPVR